MKAIELRNKFLDFFKKKDHVIIPSFSLIPENDPTVLFTTAGMHPLVPFLLGEKHPGGKRLVNYQKCIRTGDIDEVGDDVHLTFFEMLGNWSLGDYWKKEAIEWSFEFLTSKKWLGIPVEKLAISCFAGDQKVPQDDESAGLWRTMGILKEKIYFFGRDDNWWGPAGKTGPCGPDTEMFYWTGKGKPPPLTTSDNKEGWVEIWNNVFMEYNKTEKGEYLPLKQKNVDTGMGLERTLTVLNGKDSVFDTELFVPIINKIQELSKIADKKSERIMADHLRAACFILAENIEPSNVEQGYVLRKLIRRAVRYGRKLGIKTVFSHNVAESIINVYGDIYHELSKNKDFIFEQLIREEEKFKKTLEKGLQELKKIYGRAIGGVDRENLPRRMVIKDNRIRIDGKKLFHIYETYGLPIEISQEIMTEWGLTFDEQTIKEAKEAFQRHQELSRQGAEKKFSGGLADHSEKTVKLHTATHLLQAALRKVLGNHVKQKGSNITTERLRFDFSHPEKLTDEQKQKVENLVNEQIKNDFPVTFKELTVKEARAVGAIGFFEEKYDHKVKVYQIDDFSLEICGGPHVKHTAVLGQFKIIKEEAVSSGIRRIKAKLD